MDEQAVPIRPSTSNSSALMRVLILSIALSVGAVFSLVYFFGSERMTRDVLVHPEAFSKISIRDLDLKSGRSETFYIDKIELQELADGKIVSRFSIDEQTYKRIFKILEKDLFLLSTSATRDLFPRYKILFHMKPDTSAPFDPIILQEIEIFSDNQTYRVTGRRDLQKSDRAWLFKHKGVIDEIESIAQLSQSLLLGGTVS